MKEKNKNDNLVISYLTLRFIVGILAFVFPFFLVFGTAIYDKECCFVILSSISSYYHSSADHIFGGVIIAIAIFLYAYRGYEKNDDSCNNCNSILCRLINLSDNRTGNIACFGAVGLTLFPVSIMDDKFSWIEGLHYFFAAVFFLSLIYFSLCLFTKSKDKILEPQKIKENKIYKYCGYFMLACIVLIAVGKILEIKFESIEDLLSNTNYVFYLEVIALWAFGISWFVKGKGINRISTIMRMGK